MTADDIIRIIDTIPNYIIYIFPGYITIYVYLFLKGISIKDTKAIIIKSIGISYVYVVFLQYWNFPNEFIQIMALTLISVCVPYFIYKMVHTPTMHWVLRKLGIYTTYMDNEIESLEGFDHGAWIVIYLYDENMVYEGFINSKELEEGKRQYICLSQYFKYQLDDSGKPIKPYLEDHAGDDDEQVVIYYKDIKRIEKRKT